MNFKPANIPVNDDQRVKAVKRTGVLDENKTELYDIYCFLAKEITGCPVSWTGVIDNEKQNSAYPASYNIYIYIYISA